MIAMPLEKQLGVIQRITREQKRALVAESLKAYPQLSDREHARRTGANHKTVGAVRRPLEQGGEIPQLDYRENPQGRPQPARRTEPKPTPPQPFTERLDDAIWFLSFTLRTGDLKTDLNAAQRARLTRHLQDIIEDVEGPAP